MKKLFAASILLVAVMASCTTSYTTVATPKPQDGKMIVTSGDLPNKNYTVLGFVESSASTIGIGLPTETKISAMQTSALNDGLVRKAENLGADAVINVAMTTSSSSTYLVFLQTNIFVTGTAIKFK